MAWLCARPSVSPDLRVHVQLRGRIIQSRCEFNGTTHPGEKWKSKKRERPFQGIMDQAHRQPRPLQRLAGANHDEHARQRVACVNRPVLQTMELRDTNKGQLRGSRHHNYQKPSKESCSAAANEENISCVRLPSSARRTCTSPHTARACRTWKSALTAIGAPVRPTQRITAACAAPHVPQASGWHRYEKCCCC